jgi:hypothetical protein
MFKRSTARDFRINFAQMEQSQNKSPEVRPFPFLA